jgi:hypothetical protein
VTAIETSDRFAAARAVADTVLYEGYLLYPYRSSSTKNQLRWQFGVVVPRGFAAIDASERPQVRTEVVLDCGPRASVAVRARFLQVQRRTVDEAGVTSQPWDETREHEIDVAPVPLDALDAGSRTLTFRIEGGEDVQLEEAGRTVRRRAPIEGRIGVEVTPCAGATPARRKVAVTVANEVEWNPVSSSRDEASCRSLVGVHVLICVDDGAFVSSIDPPDDAAEAVASCANDGLFPVLVDDGHGSDVVLASPIILYDHPSVAPESVGDMFDATEIDEILALRVLTLTDEEKAEARRTDAKAAAIIDRCDNMPPELWARLHGAVRSLRPIEPETSTDEATPWWDPAVDASFDPFGDTLCVSGTDIGVGTRVRLRPSRRADAHDMFLVGMDATVSGIFNDVDGDVLVAVTLDDDPAAEAFTWQGRYLFFHPDEIEVR